jgi:hypothetical protein
MATEKHLDLGYTIRELPVEIHTEDGPDHEEPILPDIVADDDAESE